MDKETVKYGQRHRKKMLDSFPRPKNTQSLAFCFVKYEAYLLLQKSTPVILFPYNRISKFLESKYKS